MLKRFFVFSALGILVGGFLLGAAALAQTDESAVDESLPAVTAEELDVAPPTVLPNSRWYFLKEWWRGVKLGLTLNEEKKEELRLQQMNERLLEVQELFNGPVDPQAQAAIAKVLAKYQEQSVKFGEKITDWREQLAKNEKLQELLAKNSGWELKRQYLLERLANQAAVEVEVKQQLQTSMDQSLSHLATWLSLWGELKPMVAGLDQAATDGNQLQQLHNLQVLNDLEARLSGQAQIAVGEVKERTEERLNEELQTADKNVSKKLLEQLVKLEPSVAAAEAVVKTLKIPPASRVDWQEIKQERIKVEKQDVKATLQEVQGLFEAEAADESAAESD